MSAAGRYDYVITGGGLAGCVLAARLTEDPTVSVLLLEAGPKPRSLWIGMPAGMGRLFVNKKYNWGYLSEVAHHLAGRELYLPQGKTLGGSSAINGMAFVRGHAEDYDQWRAQGNAGWGWRDVLPLFQRMETRPEGDPALRGQHGPLQISSPSYVHASSRAFIAAAMAAGLPANADYNGVNQEGTSLLQFTIHRGRRHAAAEAYLRPAYARPNLTVRTGAFVHRVRIAAGRARGVEAEVDGQQQVFEATREVLVTGGAFGSPRILLHSGIGTARSLEALGIPVHADLPGVGANLVDHPYVHMTWGTTSPHSLNAHLRGWRVYAHGARWLACGTGPLTIGASQSVAFICTSGESRPSVQVNFRPISFRFDASGRLGPDPEPRLTAAACVLRPRSVGSLALRSADPRTPPSINCNYLSEARDEQQLMDGVRWARRIFAAAPLRDIVVSEDTPGPDVDSDAQLRDYLRRTTQTMGHPVGTCRMGAGVDAVVDAQLRVHGIEGLRVVDSSIMPSITSGNTAAPTFMIAEKGVDLLRAAARGGHES